MIVDDPHHRVVARHVDGPVVVEYHVGESGQLLGGVVVGVTDGLVGTVGAGQHDRFRWGDPGAGHLCQQQVMDRRVRQHQADQRVTGSDSCGDRRVDSALQQHHWPGRTGQNRGFGRTDLGVAARDLKVAHQDGEGLAAAGLALPQF